MAETAVLEAEMCEPHTLADVEHTEAPASRRLDQIEASAVERANRNGTASGETADAGTVHRASGSRVSVVAIDPATYPHFANDRDHPFIGMEAIERLKEFVTCCAQLWARACHEQVRAGKRAA